MFGQGRLAFLTKSAQTAGTTATVQRNRARVGGEWARERQRERESGKRRLKKVERAGDTYKKGERERDEDGHMCL